MGYPGRAYGARNPHSISINCALSTKLAKGCKPSIDPIKVRKLKAEGLGASEIADALRIGRSSVYRVLDDCTRR
jgi:hypothetical protein